MSNHVFKIVYLLVLYVQLEDAKCIKLIPCEIITIITSSALYFFQTLIMLFLQQIQMAFIKHILS